MSVIILKKSILFQLNQFRIFFFKMQQLKIFSYERILTGKQSGSTGKPTHWLTCSKVASMIFNIREGKQTWSIGRMTTLERYMFALEQQTHQAFWGRCQ